MKTLIRIIDFLVRFVVNLALWLLFPLIAIAHLLLYLMIGIVLAFGAGCYIWLMWGIGVLLFDHSHGAFAYGMHDIAAGGLRLAITFVICVLLLALELQYEPFVNWLNNGGLFQPKRPDDEPFDNPVARRRAFKMPARWSLWRRFQVWRAKRFLDRNTLSLEFRHRGS